MICVSRRNVRGFAMWNRMDRFERTLFIAGIAYLLGAAAALVVMLRVDRAPAPVDGLLILCFVLALFDPGYFTWEARRHL